MRSGLGFAQGWDCGVRWARLTLIKSFKDKPKWTELLWVCFRDMFLGIAGRPEMVHGLWVPLRSSGCVAHMSGLTCLGTGLVLYLEVSLLDACCCSLYWHCSSWMQGSALLANGPSWKTSSHSLCGEEPTRGGLYDKWRQSGFLTQMCGQLREAVSHNLENGSDKWFP